MSNLMVDYPTYVSVDASKYVATLEVMDSVGRLTKYVFAVGPPTGQLFFGTEEEYLAALED